MRPEALVRAAAAEREVVGWVARDVEPMRVGVAVGVAVAGGEPHDHLLALGDLDVADSDVASGRAPEEPHRSGEPEELLGRGRDQRPIGAQASVLIGMLGERERPEADRLPRRLVTGDDQERERVVQVLVVTSAALRSHRWRSG